MLQSNVERLTLEPIGYVRTGKDLKFEAPHQPNPEDEETNQVILLPGKQFDLALLDLEGFDHIWLVWWFHRNTNWRPKVVPPRGQSNQRRGVFATRSPHRPNPIGLTAVRLHRVEGLTLTVGPLDLVDGTPILDIKPYLPTADAFPNSRAGWVDEMNEALAQSPRFEVEWANEAIPMIKVIGADIANRAEEILSIHPRPHRTRRIIKIDERLNRLACGPWRLYFSVANDKVTIHQVTEGNAG